jgi:nicotinic acetylcholine receptor, invertebrate
MVQYDGKILWTPPMIYKSYCAINIEYYPFDIQECYMKFGCWTFDGSMVDLEHININNSKREINPIIRNDGSSVKLYEVETGIDMSDYYESVEWAVLAITAQKNIKYYECCPEPYYDIYFNITIQRKTLFYTVNLIIPCVNISFLSVLVFYLPSDSGEKLSLGISILVALLVFYLLLIELIPPTSLVVPLLGKYLLFTLILVNLSILFTIFVLNLHHRKPNMHKMPIWMRRLFIDIMPKMLMIERPFIAATTKTSRQRNNKRQSQVLNFTKVGKKLNENRKALNTVYNKLEKFAEPLRRRGGAGDIETRFPPSIMTALKGINYISDFMSKQEDNQEVKFIKINKKKKK